METQSQVLILLLFISSLVSTLVIAPSPSPRIGAGLLGGYQKIKDVKDPRVQEVAKFAVTEYNRQANTNLMFDSVIKGEYQVVAGTNYRLVIAAKNGMAVKNYSAEVYDKIYEGYIKLVSFKPVLKAV